MTTNMHDDRLDEFIRLLAKSRWTPSPMMFALATAVLIGGVMVGSYCARS
jgi:hypothetical protein